MSDNNQDWELLNAFADGELPEELRADFEARLVSDADLQRELDKILSLKATLSTMDPPADYSLKPAANDHAPKGRFKKWALSVGVAASVIGMIGYSYLNSHKSWDELALKSHRDMASQNYVVDVSPVQSAAWVTPEIGILAPDLTGARLYLVDMKMSNQRDKAQVAIHYRGLRGCSLTIFAMKNPDKLMGEIKADDLLTHTWSDQGLHFAMLTKGMDVNRFRSIALYSQEMISHQLHKDKGQYARFENNDNAPCA
ncbi:hypothetical protein RYZ26_06445 [Terasakiella sp. A23]|uniref:anti-sigma factor family protein n=1 Tax=Terasakiella sp. FCG-A23 TaxID=3080561 RepID=UPI002953D34E|nr:hypothetical protein [Terasakiella sp. A23]MDV7339224.1 hypothetical protein [Terasakiella sp. A23]